MKSVRLLTEIIGQFQPGRRTREQEAAAEKRIREFYESLYLPAPQIIWASSPDDARKLSRAGHMAQQEKLASGNTAALLRFGWDRWTAAVAANRLIITMLLSQEMPRLLPMGSGWDDRWDRWQFPVIGSVIGAIMQDDTDAMAAAYIWRAAITGWFTRSKVMLVRWPLTVLADGDGRAGRMHNGNGPAVTWPDGTAQYRHHGRPVSEWLQQRPKLLALVTEMNTERRRELITAYGWEALKADAGLEQIGADTPDPGNPGQLLRLWRFRSELFGLQEQVLECTNGSLEPDNSRRSFLLYTGRRVKDPVQAAAMLAGLNAAAYRQLERRT